MEVGRIFQVRQISHDTGLRGDLVVATAIRRMPDEQSGQRFIAICDFAPAQNKSSLAASRGTSKALHSGCK